MKIFLSTKADRELRRLPKKMHNLLISRVEDLAKDPFPLQSRKLTSRLGWRIRIGDYRILYTVDKHLKEITILSVAHRKDAYRV